MAADADEHRGSGDDQSMVERSGSAFDRETVDHHWLLRWTQTQGESRAEGSRGLESVTIRNRRATDPYGRWCVGSGFKPRSYPIGLLILLPREHFDQSLILCSVVCDPCHKRVVVASNIHDLFRNIGSIVDHIRVCNAACPTSCPKDAVRGRT